VALRQVIDPEIGINVVDLGLVYDIDVYEDEVHIQMTLTSPGCPMGPQIVSETKAAAESVEGVSFAEVTLVWEPYWTSDMIDSRVRAYMGF
jgi:metal-sulfur cluster biosynthetic enzyme